MGISFVLLGGKQETTHSRATLLRVSIQGTAYEAPGRSTQGPTRETAEDKSPAI
jgi:hypothetical protein